MCALALLAGVSYLPSSETDGADARDGAVGKVSRGATEVRYGLEHAQRRVSGLLP